MRSAGTVTGASAGAPSRENGNAAAAAGSLSPIANGNANAGNCVSRAANKGAAGSGAYSVASAARPDTGAVRDAIAAIVAAEFRLPLSHILSPTRGSRRAARARQVAMYLAHVGGLSLTDVGLMFGRDRTTVAHACGIVEDGRDRVVYDRRIDRLEGCVAQSLDPVGQAA